MEKKERRRKLINKLYEIHSHTHDCILFGTCYVAFQVVLLCCYVDVEKERKRERHAYNPQDIHIYIDDKLTNCE